MDAFASTVAAALLVSAAGAMIVTAKSDRSLFFKLLLPTVVMSVVVSLVTLWQGIMLSSLAHDLTPLVRPAKVQAASDLLSQWLAPRWLSAVTWTITLTGLIGLIVAYHYDDKGGRDE